MLIFLLEKGIIDGALVVRMREDQPLELEPFIARTKEEIISTSKFKYCPSQHVEMKTNIDSTIKITK